MRREVKGQGNHDTWSYLIYFNKLTITLMEWYFTIIIFKLCRLLFYALKKFYFFLFFCTYSLWGTTWDKIFKRDRKCVYPLSLLWCWRHWCYASSISVKETVVACSTVEWPLILSSSLFLTIHISMAGSPGDVSKEPVT